MHHFAAVIIFSLAATPTSPAQMKLAGFSAPTMEACQAALSPAELSLIQNFHAVSVSGQCFDVVNTAEKAA